MALYPILIFALLIMIVALYLAFKTANDDIQAMDVDSSFKTPINDFVTRYVKIWDFFGLMLVIGFIVSMIISAYLIRTHPVFVGFTLFVYIIIAMIGIHLSNAFHDTTTSSGFIDVIGDFTIIPYLGLRIPHLVVLACAVFIIVLYAKDRGAQAI